MKPHGCLLFVGLILLVSCQHAGKTVNGRIDQNANLFNTKTFSEKKLISLGELAPGMTRDSVYLAWGDPSEVHKGIENGVAFEEWTYLKRKPGVDMNLGLGTGGIGLPGLNLDKKLAKVVRFQKGVVSGYRIVN